MKWINLIHQTPPVPAAAETAVVAYAAAVRAVMVAKGRTQYAAIDRQNAAEAECVAALASCGVPDRDAAGIVANAATVGITLAYGTDAERRQPVPHPATWVADR